MSDEIRMIRNPEGSESGAGAADTSKPPEELESAPVKDEINLKCTGLGNSQRFVTRWGSIVRYVKVWRQWFIWNGKRWEPDTTNQIVELAKAVVKEMVEEAVMLGDEKAYRWAAVSASEGRLTEMVSLSESDPVVVAAPTDFDARPYVLNVENGVINYPPMRT